MWELDHKEGWVLKNWCFWIVVLEKTLKSSFDSKEIKPINPKGNQYWRFTGRTDAEGEAPVLWPHDVKSWLIGKKVWCWERMRARGEGSDRGLDDWIANSMDISWSKLQEIVKDKEAWHATVHGSANNCEHDWNNWTWLSNWTTTTMVMYLENFRGNKNSN